LDHSGFVRRGSCHGDEIVKTLALEMRKNIRHIGINATKLSIAFIFDPRSKLAYSEYTYSKAFGNEVSKKQIEL